jgi:hypothetical protein
MGKPYRKQVGRVCTILSGRRLSTGLFNHNLRNPSWQVVERPKVERMK